MGAMRDAARRNPRSRPPANPPRARRPAGRSGRTPPSRSSRLGPREIEHARVRLEPLGTLDLEGLAQPALEEIELVVGVKTLALRRQELLDHRVLTRRELDDERRSKRREPVDDLLDGHVRADREVMDQRQREHEVGLAPVGQRSALEPPPAEARRGVGEVHGERNDLGAPLAPQLAVEQLDRTLIRVERHDGPCAFRRDAGVAPVVATDVPDEIPLARPRNLAHELVLASGVVVRVGVALAVLRPDPLGWIPLETVYELAHLLYVGDEQLLLEDPLDLLLHLIGPVRVPPLEPRVQEDIAEDAPPKAVARRQQAPHLLRRDAVDRPPQPRLERNALQRLQEQRVEVEHAELAVAHPRLALPHAFEGAHADEYRSNPLELEVVRSRSPHDPLVVEQSCRR